MPPKEIDVKLSGTTRAEYCDPSSKDFKEQLDKATALLELEKCKAEALEVELAEAKGIVNDLPDHSDLDAATFLINKLEADNARLREALEKYKDVKKRLLLKKTELEKRSAAERDINIRLREEIEEKCKDLDWEAQELLLADADKNIDRASAYHYAIDKIRDALESQ